jgi:hypothetical protein
MIMMKKKNIYTCLALMATAAALFTACKKDFLDVRPNKSLLVPTTLADLRLLLDNNLVFNIRPNLTSLADGNYYTTDAGYNSYGLDAERNSYTWAPDIFGTATTGEWNTPYKQVFYSNVVLEGTEKLPAADAASEEGRAVKGTALFSRAFAFYSLVTSFAKPYDAAAASTDPGIPVRLHSDVTEKAGRGTVAQTYAQILADLAAARPLLPATATVKTRPTLAALFALQARIALAMEDYPRAGRYADSALTTAHTLIDYNTLNPADAKPFPVALPYANPEVLFYAALVTLTFDGTSSATFADRNLYDTYAPEDLRKTLFFRETTPGNYKFKGTYSGALAIFGGLATDELYLVRAECRARAGDAAGAMADLNTLLVTRWKRGTFLPYTADNPEEALRKVLTERRKELFGRNLRWEDLRRLNRDPRFRVTLNRNIKGLDYTLEPGSRRYVYPIPDQEIKLNGLEQNER